jgi:DNA-binding LytR/AlgR family response regulator
VPVSIDDIIFCESEKRCVYFVTKSGPIKTYAKLDDLERELPGHFVRCHQSYMVNFHFIKNVRKSDILLSNGLSVPIAERRKSNVMKQIDGLVDILTRQNAINA